MNELIARYQKARKDAYKYGRYHRQNHETAQDFASYVCVQMARGMYKCLRYMFRDFCAKEIADFRRTEKGKARQAATHVREDFNEEIETGFQLMDLNALVAIEEFIETNGGKNMKIEKTATELVPVFTLTLGELVKWRGGTMTETKKAEVK